MGLSEGWLRLSGCSINATGSAPVCTSRIFAVSPPANRATRILQEGMPRLGCSVYYDTLTGTGRHFIDTRCVTFDDMCCACRWQKKTKISSPFREGGVLLSSIQVVLCSEAIIVIYYSRCMRRRHGVAHDEGRRLAPSSRIIELVERCYCFPRDLIGNKLTIRVRTAVSDPCPDSVKICTHVDCFLSYSRVQKEPLL